MTPIPVPDPLASHGLPSFHNQHPENQLELCFSAVCNRSPPEDLYRFKRRVLNVIAAFFSVVLPLPFIPVSLSMGKTIGPISALGSSLAQFTLEFWAAKNATESLFAPKIRAELALAKSNSLNKRKIWKTIATIGVIFVASLASQLPSTLAGIKYNQQKYKALVGVTLLLGGSLLPLRSLQLSIEHLRSMIQALKEPKSTKLKKIMSSLITAHYQEFIKKSYRDKIAFIDECEDIRSRTASSQEKANQYVLAFLGPEDLSISQPKTTIRSAFNYTALALGTVLAGIHEFALADYTFTETKRQLWDNNAIAGIFASLAIGSTVCFIGRSIINTTQKVFHVSADIITKNETRNLGWQLRPRLSFALTTIGFLISISALGPSYVIWGDFYNENKLQRDFFRTTLCSSLFLMLFATTLDIVNEITAFSITRGTEEEKEILKVCKEFQKLTDLIEKSPSSEFMGYLKVNDQIRKELERKMNAPLSQPSTLSPSPQVTHHSPPSRANYTALYSPQRVF